MVRAEKNRRNGRLGGSPNLLKQKENQNPVGVNPNPLIPEPEPEPKPEPERKNQDSDLFEARDGPRDGPSARYVFSEGVIRLNRRDFDKWAAAYSSLNLTAELLSLSEWAGTLGDRWFFAVQNALAKRNREQVLKIKTATTQPQQRMSSII